MRISTERSFDERVWHAVSLIPRGQLATYGQVADWIGAWGCARQVGWALRRLSFPSDVPWQRVVNAKGRISMSLSREGLLLLKCGKGMMIGLYIYALLLLKALLQ